ncbi:MAG: P-loop NTPase fold protein [Pseudomonadota bacterium]
MADGEKKGLFGKLFRRKGEEQETAPRKPDKLEKEEASPKPVRPITRENVDGEDRPGPFEDLPALDPPSVSGGKTDIVELEMDIPEDEISTVALSLDDLEAARAWRAPLGDTASAEEPDDASFPDIQLETAEIQDTTEMRLDRAEIRPAVKVGAPAAEIPSPPGTTEEQAADGQANPPISLEDVDAELTAEDRGLRVSPAGNVEIDEDEEPALPRRGDVPAEREEDKEAASDEAPVTAEYDADEDLEAADDDPEILIEDDEDPDFDVTPDEVQPALAFGEPSVGMDSPGFVVSDQVPPEPPEAPAAGTGSPPPDEAAEAAPTVDVAHQEIEETHPPVYDETDEETAFLDDVAVLSKFVMNRGTPLTISIQGVSGAGKTELMHRIAADLDDSQCVKTWFPSRDYAGFCDRNEVPALLIRRMLHSFEESVPEDEVPSIRQMADDALTLSNRLWKTGFPAKAGGMAAVNADDGTGAHAAGAESDAVAGLKFKLREIVRLGLQAAGKKRIVVFVDDLDRIDPSLALDILETIGTFLSIEGCVFIAACGPVGIERGIREASPSFGVSDSSQSYFDRAFQLTVNLPFTADRVAGFVSDVLQSAGFDYSEGTLDSVVPLFRYSVGLNPRRMKRIEDRLAFAAAMSPEFCFASDGHPLPRYRNQKLLLALGCLDTEFGPVFRLLSSKRHDDGELMKLIDERLRDDGQMGDLDKKYGLLGGTWDTDRVARLIAFMDLFSDLVHAGDPNGRFHREDIPLLKQAIDLIARTSTAAPSFSLEEPGRSGLTEFCTRVKKRLHKLLPSLAPDGSVRTIRNWPSPRPWFGLWYTGTVAKKVWGLGRVYYEVSFDSAGGNMVSVGLKCKTAGLDDFGVDRGAVDRLKDASIVKDGRYQVNEHDSGWLEIVKDLFQCTCGHVDEVNDDEVEGVAKELKELVRSTHDIFDTRPQAEVPRDDKRQLAKRALPPCKVCGSDLQQIITKEGDTGFKCGKCGKIYKPKIPKPNG